VLRSLAPDDRTWAHEDLREFERSYVRQLEELGAERILADLRRVGAGRPVIMLCWERLADPDEYCHRLTLSRWLRERAGVEARELRPGDPQREDVAQRSLF